MPSIEELLSQLTTALEEATPVARKKPKTIVLTDEARAAVRRKPPTVARLLKMLLSNDEKDMPTSEQVRYMAFFVLTEQTYGTLRFVDKKGKEVS